MSETTDTKTADYVRVYDDQLAPVPGVWSIDPTHTILGFECAHMMMTRLRGWFASFSGAFHVAEAPEESSVEVTIDADSLQMPNPVAVSVLKGENWLEVDKYKTLHFRSTRVQHVEANLLRVAGDLTIKDATREVVLDATFEGAHALPPQLGGAKIGFVATTNFDRRDFGLEWNMPLPSGGWLVGNRVDLRLDVEATQG
jgi:polyisoprenoid-binding protein YceI